MKDNYEQRKVFGEKLLELAHLIFGGLVVGQFFSGQQYSFELAGVGVLLPGLLYWISYKLTLPRR